MILWESLIKRWHSHPYFHLHTLHWIHVHLNTQAALSVQQPQRSSLPFKFHLSARQQAAKTHSRLPKPTDQLAWGCRQELAHTCSYPLPPRQYGSCPRLPPAATRLSLCTGFPRRGWHGLTAAATWLSQPCSTHCQGFCRGQNESIPPSY